MKTLSTRHEGKHTAATYRHPRSLRTPRRVARVVAVNATACARERFRDAPSALCAGRC